MERCGPASKNLLLFGIATILPLPPSMAEEQEVEEDRTRATDNNFILDLSLNLLLVRKPVIGLINKNNTV